MVLWSDVDILNPSAAFLMGRSYDPYLDPEQKISLRKQWGRQHSRVPKS